MRGAGRFSMQTTIFEDVSCTPVVISGTKVNCMWSVVTHCTRAVSGRVEDDSFSSVVAYCTPGGTGSDDNTLSSIPLLGRGQIDFAPICSDLFRHGEDAVESGKDGATTCCHPDISQSMFYKYD